jgi:predicted secreted hydrolase
LRPGELRVKAGQSGWRGDQIYAGHFAITDEGGQSFVHFERLAREALGAGSSSGTAVDVHVDDWSLVGSSPFRMHARAGSDALTLTQFSEKPPAVHGHDGVSIKAGCATCASHYYSLTRLKTAGTLTFNGQTFAVTGVSWMDHEFGSGELQANQAGWDWFSLQLNDGRELMLYRLRQKDGSVTPQSSGSLIDARGAVTHLLLRDFSIEPTGSWKSPHTAATYPSGWRVRVPRAGIDVVLAPTVLDQELANANGGISYWEGAVDVRGAAGAAAGVGYVELTGYAGNVAL